MKKVFIGLSGGLGPVFRTLPIAEELKKLGYDVYFSVYGEQSAQIIEEKGFVHLEDDDPTYPDPQKMIPVSEQFYNLDHYYAQLGLLDERFVRSWIKHRMKMIRELDPDFVIADMSPHTLISAKYLNKPSVSITQSCFHPKGEPLYSEKEVPRNIPKVTPVINKVLSSIGLPQINKIEELNQGNIDIVPSIPEFDLISSDNVHYVGPIEYDLTSDIDLKFELSDPYILVYPGRLYDSAGNSGMRLLNVLKHGFVNKEQKVIVASMETLPEEWKSDLSPNITIIPQFNTELLQQADLFIHHGGHGSCLSAIKRGIPSLIIPTHTERLFNAKKVSELELGDYMLSNIILGENLYKMSNYIINDTYKAQLSLFKDKIQSNQYRGAEQVIEILKREDMLS